jgi:hypothetical protein
MPPLTQFAPKLDGVNGALIGAGTGPDVIQVRGPLKLDHPEKYALPIAIHFTIVQTKDDLSEREEQPESEEQPKSEEQREAEEHAPGNANFAYGCLEVTATDLTNEQWEKELTVKQGKFYNGEARGIAVAVFPIDKDFTYETLTWCGHINLTGLRKKVQQSTTP